ncbi:hypothetical protein CY35_02G071100 [Sphagnum magellanicum]|nr:hypothetical protein CY35_02G071100 [Sphagnum magellanicum]
MKSPPPQRRLVLEILMSPSGDGQVGSFPHATGVRLKLETNGSLDSLTSLAAAASSDSTQNGDAEIWTGTSENSTRNASGTTKSGSLVARQGANQAGASLQKEEAMPAGM